MSHKIYVLDGSTNYGRDVPTIRASLAGCRSSQQPNSLFTRSILCSDLVQPAVVPSQSERSHYHTSAACSADGVASSITGLCLTVPPDPLRYERADSRETVIDSCGNEHGRNARHVAGYPRRQRVGARECSSSAEEEHGVTGFVSVGW